MQQHGGRPVLPRARTAALRLGLGSHELAHDALDALAEARVPLDDAAVAGEAAGVRHLRPRVPRMACLRVGGSVEAPHGVDARGQQGRGAARDGAGGVLHRANVCGAGRRSAWKGVGAVEGRGCVG
jgi:hypothetical protein